MNTEIKDEQMEEAREFLLDCLEKWEASGRSKGALMAVMTIFRNDVIGHLREHEKGPVQ